MLSPRRSKKERERRVGEKDEERKEKTREILLELGSTGKELSEGGNKKGQRELRDRGGKDTHHGPDCNWNLQRGK